MNHLIDVLGQVIVERVALVHLQIVGFNVGFDVINSWIRSFSKLLGRVSQLNANDEPKHA